MYTRSCTTQSRKLLLTLHEQNCLAFGCCCWFLLSITFVWCVRSNDCSNRVMYKLRFVYVFGTILFLFLFSLFFFVKFQRLMCFSLDSRISTHFFLLHLFFYLFYFGRGIEWNRNKRNNNGVQHIIHNANPYDAVGLWTLSIFSQFRFPFEGEMVRFGSVLFSLLSLSIRCWCVSVMWKINTEHKLVMNDILNAWKTLLLILCNVRLYLFFHHYLRSLAFHTLLSILFICCSLFSLIRSCLVQFKIAKWRDGCVMLLLCCFYVRVCFVLFGLVLFSFL